MRTLLEDDAHISWTEANEQAALWHARLDAGTADETAFATWRDADPRHAAAFARIAATADTFRDIGPVDLSKDADFSVPRVSRRQWLQMVAVGGTLAVGGTAWLAIQSPARASTVVGERKTLQLPRGLVLELNTDTTVRWKTTSGVSRVWLDRGEIGVLVAEAGGRCDLLAAGQVVQTTAGNLNVRLRDAALDLTVLTGVCTVVLKPDASTERPPVVVRAGESALVTQAAPRVRISSDAERAFTAGWREDVLVFDGQTLGVAVEEYNRYLTRKITIIDSDLAGIRIGGRFKSRDPKAFLDTLQASFGVHVATDDTGAVLLSR